MPIFGRYDTPLEERTYRRFGLEVEDATERRRFVVEFDVFAGDDLDGGSLVTMLNARNELAQANATIAFLGHHLRDDDGISVDWVAPVEPEEDPDRPGEWLRDDEPTDEEPDGEPLYRWHDDSLMTRAELSEAAADLDPIADASSRRRFAYLSDSPRYRYRFDAIQQISEFLTKGVVNRPTRRSTPSGRGRQSTGRGSGGRSR